MSRDSAVCKSGNNYESRNIYLNKDHEGDKAVVNFLRQKPQSHALPASPVVRMFFAGTADAKPGMKTNPKSTGFQLHQKVATHGWRKSPRQERRRNATYSILWLTGGINGGP